MTSLSQSGSITVCLVVLGIITTVDAREPRIVFNDDAQMLMETPADGAAEFVKAWLDKEVAAVPFSTYVFLAATPDICTYDSKVGETYGDRFGNGYSRSWALGISREVLDWPRIQTETPVAPELSRLDEGA